MIPELNRFRATERRVLRWLRRLVDAADECLHRLEVHVREEAADADLSLPVRVEPARIARSEGNGLPATSTVAEDEFGDDRIQRRIPRDRQPQRAAQAKRKRRMTAAEFDLRFAGSRP
jgi:hypothetical protein